MCGVDLHSMEAFWGFTGGTSDNFLGYLFFGVGYGGPQAQGGWLIEILNLIILEIIFRG